MKAANALEFFSALVEFGEALIGMLWILFIEAFFEGAA